MLPFTKRPGRDESGDNDVVTKDDVATPATVPPSAASKKSAPAAGGRAKFASMNEEEMTTLMPTKSLGDAVRAAVRPAAGAPPPSRSSSPSPSSPSPSSRSNAAPPSRTSSSSASRSGKFAAIDEDEDGRTVVRGAPKIVKRTTNGPSSAKMGMPTSPTTISPAAVIKATLESARGAQAKRTGEHLMAGPPSALLEDIADRHPADVGAEHTAILQAPSSTGSKSGSIGPPPMVQGVPGLSTQMLQPQAMPHGTIPPGSARPLTNPPPPNSHPNLSNQSGGYPAHQSGGYAAQSGGYAAQYPGPVPAGSVSGSIVSMTGPQQQMPAHFMVPQAPYSDGRMDPPGTAVTARTKVGGRPAMSWAIALAAFGLFVGVGAVAVMHGNDGFTETSASFVDPSRAAGAKAMAPGVAAGQLAAPPTPVPVAADPPAVVGVPPVAVPAVPAVAAVAPTAEVAAAPVVTTPPAPVAPVAPVPAGGAAAVAVAVPVVAATAAPVAPTATVAVAPKPTAHHNTFVPQRPPPKPAEEVAAKPARPVKPAAGSGKPGGDSAVDEEQRKALKALQESQLETPF